MMGKNEEFAALDIEIGEDRSDILTRGNAIATMNSNIHLVLSNLPSRKVLKYTGLIALTELNQKLGTSAKNKRGVNPAGLTCGMSMLVFGHRSIADTLARDLCRFHLFLQYPDPMPTDVVYDNPQYLGIVGSSFVNEELLPPIPIESLQQGTERPSELDHDEEEDLGAVIDNLPKHDYPRVADAGGGLRTPLLE